MSKIFLRVFNRLSRLDFFFSKAASQILPFLALVLLSLVLLALAYEVSTPFLQNIFSNMAATSLYALVALFTYDVVKRFSERAKNRELREYAHSEIDPQIMAVLFTVTKLIYLKEENPLRNHGSGEELEDLTTQVIASKIKKREYVGFEILRNSSETTKNIRELIENNFIRPQLDDALVLLLLKIANRLERLFSSLSQPSNLIKSDKPAVNDYIILGSREIASYNASYPNRRLLLKKIPEKEGLGVVEDFADFAPELEQNDLLSFYSIEASKVEYVASTIKEILDLAKKWVKRR